LKKFISYTIAASLLVPAVIAPIQADAKTIPIDELPLTSTTTNVANTYKELERLIDVRLVNRENRFELHFNRNNDTSIEIKDVKQHIINYVTDQFHFKEASPYVGWSIEDIAVETIDSEEKMTFIITPRFYTSLTEEKNVDTTINTISERITTKNMTDYQKTLAIYEYVTQFKLTKDGTRSNANSTYTLLNENKGSALTFALLTYRLLEHNNIPVKVINGAILGDATDNLDVNHFWNLVYLNGNWYHIDSALGAGYTGQVKQFPYNYFLISDKTLRQTHNWTGYSTLPATNTQYEKYREWKKMQHANKHLVYINGQDLRNELGVDNKILKGFRVKDFVYDDRNNWIYFIGESHGNYLYKIRPDGERFQVVSRERGEAIKIEEIKKQGQSSDYQLVYQRAAGSTQIIKIENQDTVDKKEALVVDHLIKNLPTRPTIKEIAEVRTKYNLLPIEARKFLSFEATLLWAAAQDELTINQSKSVDIAVQIALLDELKPTFRTDVEAARNAYEQLTSNQKQDIFNYYDLQYAERQVQDNLSIALQLDREVTNLDVDQTSYQNDIFRYMKQFNDLTFAQQVLVVKAPNLFKKNIEVLQHIGIAADFDYRIEMLEENDARIIDKVTALRRLYNEIHVVQDRNIKRYDRLIALEKYIDKLLKDVKGWQDNVEALYLHYQTVRASEGTPTPVIANDTFVANLIAYQDMYDEMKKPTKVIVKKNEAQLTEMYKWASMTFSTLQVQEVEKEIEKLSIDLREIEERIKPVTTAYFKLSANEQLIVKNYKKLLDLEKWIIYKKDIASTINAINKINNMPTWASFKNAAYEARFIYDNLNDYAKSKITNYTVLTAAEAKIKNGDPSKPPVVNPKPPTSTNDKIEVEGTRSSNGYQFKLTSSIAKETIAIDGDKDLFLYAGSTSIAIPSSALNERFARLAEAEISLSIVKDHAVTLTITLLNGNQKRIITYLDDYITIKLPTHEILEDSYDKVFLNSEGTNFGAVPFYEEGNAFLIKPRTVGTYFSKDYFAEFDDTYTTNYEDAINFLTNRYIVRGTSHTTYEPNAPLTRAQFSLMVARALDLLQTPIQADSFVDTKGKEFEQAVMALQKYEIIKGVTPDYFKPYDNLTRQQGLVMMKRLLESLNVTLNFNGYEPFLDDWSLLSSEAKDAYIALEHLDLIDVSDNNFHPYQKLKRDEMAHMLSQTLKEAKLY